MNSTLEPQTKTTQSKFNLRARNNEDARNAADRIYEARQSLIEAVQLLKQTPGEQTRVLDLLEVFRDFTERKEVSNTGNILATQTTALEKVIRQFEKSTEFSWNKSPILGVQMQPSRPTFSQVIQKDLSKDYKPLESGPTATPNSWKFVGSQKKQNPEIKHIRLVLRLSDTSPGTKPRELWDSINTIAKELGYVGIFALSTSKSTKGNLILQLLNKTTRDFFQNHSNALRERIGFTTILEDSSCFKVVVHGVNTQDFNSDESLSLIREEIELFNPGIELTTNPIWLTSYAKKQEQQGASILVTVQTEEEAKTAIQNRLFVGGVSVRTEFAKDKQRLPQNSQC
jgi:uncharacterized protein YegP (UPF0339 family)